MRIWSSCFIEEETEVQGRLNKSKVADQQWLSRNSAPNLPVRCRLTRRGLESKVQSCVWGEKVDLPEVTQEHHDNWDEDCPNS